ncbi:nucleoside-diphosphate sugar epimerase/dehydratase [Piscinibacter sp. HJYY11]|uniref:polysaccharide biosynthesis protein n=1 Tax=Piscinibacter sp. HJYY11 TaxID=2801333 RepID=UPI00191FB688|nr:nucleoside-diphosphate sugar epimerase/dehydratase [Piscinibacter sp. HJYY11]MBL0727936.1 polysaccharide biosynthesis protein [Piscinibacter sp. HJYY11]
MRQDHADPGLTVWHKLDRVLARLRPRRQPLSLVIDGLVIALCWNITYLFRLGFERWISARPSYDPYVMVGVVAVYLLAFLVGGIPRGMWRFSGFDEVKRLTIACLGAGAACAVMVSMARLAEVPRAVLALHPFIALMGVCVVRIAYRMLYEHARSRITGSDVEVRRAIVMGAGEAAKRLLATIHQQGWIVLGLLDDDKAKQGGRIGGVQVMGSLADVAREDVRAGATHVIVALPGATAPQRRRAVDLAATTGLPVLTVPSASELQDGRAHIERVRSIEPEDLLGREPVELDERGVAELISGKTVLITGAGGSIGSELCRQVARYGPSRLVLFELSELALYQIEQQLSELHPHLPLVRLIGDVKSLQQITHACMTYRPQLVFHAAAYKHVPLMEDENAWMALHNNTLGTWHAANAAAQCGAERFVLISTDKAVNPTNVMGASKRAAEMLLSHLATQGHRTKFVAVRFGNVLGSSGSVIPKFKEQIARGGPITVTHPEITRYFMTIPEAARLVVQAAALAESGEVYVLEMGDPVKIVDLARDLIRLSGHGPGEIGIVFSGLRPGEKLYEELLADADDTLASAHPRLRIAKLKADVDARWASSLLEWLTALDQGRPADHHRARLQAFIPEYRQSHGMPS